MIATKCPKSDVVGVAEMLEGSHLTGDVGFPKILATRLFRPIRRVIRDAFVVWMSTRLVAAAHFCIPHAASILAQSLWLTKHHLMHRRNRASTSDCSGSSGGYRVCASPSPSPSKTPQSRYLELLFFQNPFASQSASLNTHLVGQAWVSFNSKQLVSRPKEPPLLPSSFGP